MWPIITVKSGCFNAAVVTRKMHDVDKFTQFFKFIRVLCCWTLMPYIRTKMKV